MKKNLKFWALAALFSVVSANAFAQDEADRSVNGIKYKLTTNADKSKTALVVGVNTSATDAQKKTIVIPATVTGDNNVVYKVTGFESTTWGANAADKCESLTINLDNFAAAIDASAFSAFTKLKTLVLSDANTAANAKTKEFPAGISKTIESVTLTNNITKIAASAFENCTKLATINLANVVEIADKAFYGTIISELTIPATVKVIGTDAFAHMYAPTADGKSNVGLTTLVFNANDAFTAIPAAFSDNITLKNVTIKSAKATSITANAFSGATAIETIDLSGATALTSAEEAFAASDKLATLKLNGTKLTAIDVDITKAQKTLATLTLPATLTTLAEKQFRDFVALTALDLSVTGVKSIPANLFDQTGATKDDKDKTIPSALASVKLNAETTEIGASAFEGNAKLATVENLNQAKLATIGASAFNKTALTTLDLTSTKLTSIPTLAFGNIPTLTSIKLPAGITTIEQAAFAYDAKVASINLQDLTKLTTLKAIFHEGAVGATDAKEVGIALASLTLPAKLTTIEDGALQLLDIEEIEIPETVTSFGERVLQGCINLKKFTWNGNSESGLPATTFLGDDKLEEVYFMSDQVDYYTWLTDDHFYGNSKDVLKVYVTAETYNMLIARFNWNENSKYSTLVGVGETEYKFNAKGLASDGYYYATYYNENSGTWFDATKFEVFGAVVEASKVVLKPFSVENGYYKVQSYDSTNPWTAFGAVVVIRSKEQSAPIELKNLDSNDVSTVDDNDLQVAAADFAASRLKFQYKLGAKDGQVKFWRVTSGTIKEGVAYLETSSIYGAREYLDIVVDGEATGIDAIESATEEAGAIYNLQGVQLSAPQKGINIKNGKKFFVK